MVKNILKKMKLPLVYRSDKRISGGKVDKCILCNEIKQLRLSHIVPSWCYDSMRKEGKIIGRYPSIGIERSIEQDGNKHYLLCDKCEEYIGYSENYCKSFMTLNDSEMNKFGMNRYQTLVAGLDLKIVHRFIFSIIIRSHYSKSAPFHNITIDDYDLNNFRSRILEPKEDDLEYPVIVTRYFSEKVERADPSAIMIPQYLTAEQFNFFSILLAGWEWIVVFNANKDFKKRFILDMRVRNNDLFKIYEADITVNRHVANSMK